MRPETIQVCRPDFVFNKTALSVMFRVVDLVHQSCKCVVTSYAPLSILAKYKHLQTICAQTSAESPVLLKASRAY